MRTGTAGATALVGCTAEGRRVAVGDTQVRFAVLGPLRVWCGGEAVALPGTRPRALLAMLLLHAGRPLGTDDLTEALWDGEPPASAPVNLRAHVRTLRRAFERAADGLGDRVETSTRGYLIRAEPGELDLAAFEEHDARGRRALEHGETAAAARQWRAALDLWRGRPLGDVRGGSRLHTAVVRLEEQRLRVAEAWIDTQLALGAHAELIGELRGLVAATPLHEPLWARLLVALQRTGRTADALDAYGQARRHLVDELGVEPGHQLQRLQRAILAGDAAIAVDAAGTRGGMEAGGIVGARGSATGPAAAGGAGATGPAAAGGAGAAADREDPGPGGPARGDDPCPYRGLMPFDTADADWYFGRERLVAELVTYLASQVEDPPSLLAVVGPSGSGKSSLLRAGLLPAMAAGLLPAARGWPTVVLTPGTRPLDALATALNGIQRLGAAPLRAPDVSDPGRLVAALHAALGSGAQPRRAVLVVDQFEELFTLCRDAAQRQAFVTALVRAAGGGAAAAAGGGVGGGAAAQRSGTGAAGPAAPAVVVLGIRADFYGHCIAFPELIPVLSGSQVVVGPMTAAELRHAIERPAARSGLRLEPGLVELLLSDAGSGPGGGARPEPGALPLLSHALLATWELREADLLTLDGYHKAGGVHGGIATTAEAVWDHLGPDEQTVARRLLTRLVAFDGQRQDTGRRIHRDELRDGPSGSADDVTRAVLDALARARLIVLGADTVEIAHEALITGWPRLQQWLSDDREALRIHRELTDAAHAWEALGRDPGALYRGARLSIARRWAGPQGHGGDMNALERAFLDASSAGAAADEAAARQRVTRRRQVIAVLLVLVLLAAAGGAIAWWQLRRNAERERLAASRELAAAALRLPPERRPDAMLLAVEAYRTAPSAQARGALAALAPEGGYRDTLAAPGRVNATAFSPDGGTLATATDGGITLWAPVDAPRQDTLHAPGLAAATALAFSPDGDVLASGHRDGTVVLWDPATGARSATLATRHGAVSALAFSPDGATLASGGSDGALLLWDPARGARRATLDAAAPAAVAAGDRDEAVSDHVAALAFSPDGGTLASGGSDGALLLWDPARGTRRATLTSGEPREGRTRGDPVSALAFHPDGTSLAVVQTTPLAAARPDDTSGRTAPAALWDVAQREVMATVDALLAETVFAVAFDRDGGRLAAGTTSGAFVLEVADDGGPPRRLARHATGPVSSLAFSPDGGTLALTVGPAITLLDPGAPQVIADGWLHRVTFDRSGRHLATSGDAAHVDLWDATAHTHLAALATPGYGDGAVAFSPSGRWVGRAGWDTVVLHHVPGEEEHRAWRSLDRPQDSRIPAAGGPVSMGIGQEPPRVFVADSFHELVLVWAPDGPPSEHAVAGLRGAALSPDGTVLATAAAAGVTLWDFPELSTPERLVTGGQRGEASLVAFSADGSVLVTVGGGTVALWDVRQRSPLATIHEDVAVRGVAVAADNRTVALAVDDPDGADRVVLWDARTRERVADLPLSSSIGGAVAFHPDGTTLAATDRERVRFWDLDPDRAITRICATLDRSRTPAQWDELIADRPHRATCDG